MPAPDNLLKLVENFGRNIDNYRSGKYNETQRLIDGLVYRLYGLSEEEIGVVEG